MISMLKTFRSICLAVGEVCGLALSGQALRYRAIILTLVICILACQAVHGQSVPPKQIYQMAKPATVRVHNQVRFECSVPDVTLNMAALSENVSSLLNRARVARDPDKVARAILIELRRDPSRYFQPQGKSRVLPGRTSESRGSGFLAHQGGYVVTNAHIVKVDDGDIERHLANRVSRENLDATLSVITRSFTELTRLSIIEREQFSEGLRKAYAHFCRIRGNHTVKRQVKIIMCPSPLSETGQTKILPAEVLVTGQGWPGKDVAVLKIGGNGYPTVPLGDESRVEVGDQVFAVGYPGAAQSAAFADSSLTDPTLTTGLISAKKAAREGFTALQTQAAQSPGSSGGPVFDASGRVIGIATASAVNPQNGQRVEGIHYMVPAGVIKEFLNQAYANWR